MEASGGYERRAFLELWHAGLACALTNPRSVRRYAEAMGVLEKTDRIDAGVIARFAAAKNLAPTPLPSLAQQRLKALVARLRQVTDDLIVQKQRRSGLLDNPEMLTSIDEVIALLKRQSRSLEGEIASMIDDDPLWAALAQSWRSIKGVAGRTVAWLHAELPEIGTYSNKSIAKLTGLAPLADDSGRHKGKRHIRGGRASVRSILFLVAAIAARYDKSLAEFRARLVAAGKEKNGHPHCLGTQAARPTQCQSTRRACRLRQCNLIIQIVAHPDRICRCDPTSPRKRGEVSNITSPASPRQ